MKDVYNIARKLHKESYCKNMVCFDAPLNIMLIKCAYFY